MSVNLPVGLQDSLLWSEEFGRGFHPRAPIDYDRDYFDKYRELDATPMGEALTNARIALVLKHTAGSIASLVDIGIGGGRFVEDADCYGYDISKQAQDWLRGNERWRSPYLVEVQGITCWDSLEHIPNPEALLAMVKRYLFVSMPIYKDMHDCLNSKHFKPGEHLHYWTQQGFIAWAEEQGFELLEINHAEQDLGREGITSFAFERVGYP